MSDEVLKAVTIRAALLILHCAGRLQYDVWRLKRACERACSAAQVARETKRKQTPGRTRPARPRRCCAAAWLTHVSCGNQGLGV